MASLKDAAQLAERLQRRSKDLRKALAEGRADFGELTRLADGIGAEADALATAFGEMDQTLGRLGSDEPAGGESLPDALSPASGSQAAGSDDGEEREELLNRAEEAGVSGPVGWMSNEKLQEAIDAEEDLTKAELLERAKKADIAGRSEMSKEELLDALRAHGS